MNSREEYDVMIPGASFSIKSFFKPSVRHRRHGRASAGK